MTERTKKLLSITPKQKQAGIWFWRNGKIEFNGIKSIYNIPKNFTGYYKEWHPNGQIWVHSFWKNGKRDGEYRNWYSNGQIYEHSFWENGELVKDLLRLKKS